MGELSPIRLVVIAIKDSIRRHEVLLPINHRHKEFKNKHIKDSFNVNKEHLLLSLSDYRKLFNCNSDPRIVCVMVRTHSITLAVMTQSIHFSCTPVHSNDC